jgi:hypothetical protein
LTRGRGRAYCRVNRRKEFTVTRTLTLTVLLALMAGTGLNCRKADEYTVLVDREDSLLVNEGTYSAERCALLAGDGLKAEFEVLNGGGPIDFVVLSDSDLVSWEAGQPFEAVIEFDSLSSGTRTAVVPTAGDYWILVSNRSDASAERRVFYEVWRKER